jgi:diguanylate cyclase (GGDEF)-like protein
MTAAARILIVDDDPTAIETLDHALEGVGEVCFATSGTAALAFMQQEPADLVLLDANMPQLDGFATCKALKQDYPELPVIFVTAFNEEGRELQALQAGAVDFIHKPIRPPVVRARVGVHLQLAAQQAALHLLNDRDPLTGIANRRVWDERLAMEWRRATRQRQPIGLLMIDIDYFKRYNDSYGHVQGDACLRQVAQALTATVTRAGELVARYGGEEFAVLLPGSTREVASALAAKICAAVRALAIPHADSAVAPWVTLSIGVASEAPALPVTVAGGQPTANGAAGLVAAEELVRQADRALYAAKAGGRDRVCTAETDGS